MSLRVIPVITDTLILTVRLADARRAQQEHVAMLLDEQAEHLLRPPALGPCCQADLRRQLARAAQLESFESIQQRGLEWLLALVQRQRAHADYR